MGTYARIGACAIVVSLPMLVGCAPNLSFDLFRGRVAINGAALDESRQIVLVVDFDAPDAHVEGDSPSYFVALIRTGGATIEEYPMKPDAHPRELEFSHTCEPANEEIRADEDRCKVWIVCADSQTVFATLDLETGETTFLSPTPPEWAIPSGGILLPPVPLPDKWALNPNAR